MKRAYLAGPDVFRPDAQAWFERARALCADYGLSALVPLDGDARSAAGIYAQNIALIQSADVVLANLNLFRGAEPDSGTCFEVGFAAALGKPVIAYVAEHSTLARQVERWQAAPLTAGPAGQYDRDGWLVEDFGLPRNLMLAHAARIVVGDLAAALAACAAATDATD